MALAIIPSSPVPSPLAAEPRSCGRRFLVPDADPQWDPYPTLALHAEEARLTVDMALGWRYALDTEDLTVWQKAQRLCPSDALMRAKRTAAQLQRHFRLFLEMTPRFNEPAAVLECFANRRGRRDHGAPQGFVYTVAHGDLARPGLQEEGEAHPLAQADCRNVQDVGLRSPLISKEDLQEGYVVHTGNQTLIMHPGGVVKGSLQSAQAAEYGVWKSASSSVRVSVPNSAPLTFLHRLARWAQPQVSYQA